MRRFRTRRFPNFATLAIGGLALLAWGGVPSGARAAYTWQPAGFLTPTMGSYVAPLAVTVDEQGNAYVTDMAADSPVFVFDSAGRQLATAASNIGPYNGTSYCDPMSVAAGNAYGQVRIPVATAVGTAPDALYVVDTCGREVTAFTGLSSGPFFGTGWLQTYQYNACTSERQEPQPQTGTAIAFCWPESATILDDGSVLVYDRGGWYPKTATAPHDPELIAYAPGPYGQNGAPLRRNSVPVPADCPLWSSDVDASSTVLAPCSDGALAYGNGTVFLTDTENGRVLTFDPATLAPTGQFGAGQLAVGKSQTGGPLGIDVTFDLIAVADGPDDRVAFFDLTGTYVGSIGSDGDESGDFNSPTGVAFDPSGEKLYVVDSGNDRVTIWLRVPHTPPPPPPPPSPTPSPVPIPTPAPAPAPVPTPPSDEDVPELLYLTVREIRNPDRRRHGVQRIQVAEYAVSEAAHIEFELERVHPCKGRACHARRTRAEARIADSTTSPVAKPLRDIFKRFSTLAAGRYRLTATPENDTGTGDSLETTVVVKAD